MDGFSFPPFPFWGGFAPPPRWRDQNHWAGPQGAGPCRQEHCGWFLQAPLAQAERKRWRRRAAEAMLLIKSPLQCTDVEPIGLHIVSRRAAAYSNIWHLHSNNFSSATFLPEHRYQALHPFPFIRDRPPPTSFGSRLWSLSLFGWPHISASNPYAGCFFDSAAP